MVETYHCLRCNGIMREINSGKNYIMYRCEKCGDEQPLMRNNEERENPGLEQKADKA